MYILHIYSVYYCINTNTYTITLYKYTAYSVYSTTVYINSPHSLYPEAFSLS